MSRSFRSCSLPELVLTLCLAVLVASCGSSTPTDPDPDPATISISIDPSSGTVEQGGSLVVTGTATIGGGFSGGVTFAVTGLPAGVTISVGTITTSGSTATAPITVTVGASVAAGTYNGTITASGSGVSDSIAYSLTVTEAPGFSLGTVENISIVQGESGTRSVAVVRSGGFAESVTITVEGAPSGMTVTPDPGSTTGNSSTLGVSVGGGVAVNTYTLTVRGSATGQPDATTTFDVTVTTSVPPDGTDFRLDFSVCTTDERPTWVAVKDGTSGSWTAVTGVADAYEFTITQSTLGVTIVYDDGVSVDVSVDYFGTSEAVLAAESLCDDGAAGKSITGTAAGIVGSTSLALGGASTAIFFDGIFGVTGVPDGAQDLVGYSTNSGTGSDRMLILRDQDIADGGDIGTIDFTADGFDPASATITVGGLVGGESGGFSTLYASSAAGSVCALSPLNSGLLGSTFTAMSAPPLEQAPDEYHVTNITAAVGDVVKSVFEAFQTLTDRTVDLPGDMPTPTLTDVTGSANYVRLQAEFVQPAELDTYTLFDYSFGSYNMTVFATAAVMSGSLTLSMPDFSGLAGWDDAWGIPVGTTGVDYVVSGTGGASIGGEETDGLCSDGSRFVTSTVTGSYN